MAKTTKCLILPYYIDRFFLNFFFKIFKLTDLKEKKKLMSFRLKVILMTIVYICTSSP